MDRRHFVTSLAGATAGAYAMGRSGGAALGQTPAAAKRREVSIAGKRIKVIDVHCHCVVDVADVVKGTPLAKSGGGGGNQVLGPQRLQIMDQQGVDVQALTINGYWWYAADRDLARRIVQVAERGAGEVGGGAPGSVRRARVGRAAASGSGGRAARARRQAAGAARRHDRRSRQRRGRLAAEVRSVLGQGGRARRAGVHAPGRRGQHPPRGRAARTRRSRQHHRQPARDHLLLHAVDLRRHARQVPRPEGLRRARRRLPAVLSRAHRRGVRRPAATPTAPTRSDRASTSSAELLVDTMVFSEEGLRHLVAEVGVGQVVYGTDVPFNWPVTVDLILNAPFLPNADKEAILGGNAAKLLRIN